MVNMDRDNWKEKLERGFAELTPDCWDEISSAISDGREVQPLREEQYRKPVRKRMPAILAAAAVLLCMFFIAKDANTVRSMLYIDVNPSICISLNSNGKVLGVDGINDDGRKVVESAFEETGNSRDLGAAVSSIIAEIDREGYFSDGTVDVLVSLSYIKQDGETSLDEACNTIKEYASAKAMKSNLVTQSFTRDETDEKAAADMGLSVGKYKFIAKLAEEGSIDSDMMNDLAEKSTVEILEDSARKNDPDEVSEEPDLIDGNEEDAGETDEADEAEYVDEQDNDNDFSVNKNKSSKKTDSNDSEDKKAKKKKEKKDKSNSEKNSNKSSGNKKDKDKNDKKKGKGK